MFAPFIDEKMSCRVWKTWALCNLSMQPSVDRRSIQICYVFAFALCSNNSIFFNLILNTYCGIVQQTDSFYRQYSSVFCQRDIIQGHLGRGSLTEKQCLHQIDLWQICGAPYWLTIGVGGMGGPSPLLSPGRWPWAVSENRLNKPWKARHWAALLYHLCFSSYLQVPAWLEFLHGLPSVINCVVGM